MRIAIHNHGRWNLRWIELCKEWNIDIKVVDCFDTNIISHIKDCDALMWSFDHGIPKDILTARNILYACELQGKIVFPNFNTCWHFDDKISQKYLLESINAPLVKTMCFYSKQTALEWLKGYTDFPIVGKLRRGAGSYNVKLLKNQEEALVYCNKMFSRGFIPGPGYLSDAKNKLYVARTLSGITNRLKKAPSFFKDVFIAKHLFPKEKGYLYMQEFIPNNKFDFRITIIGKKAWGFRRSVRKNDFRASGSGMINYNHLEIPTEMIKIAFQVSKKLKIQSMAFDFVINKTNNQPLIVEISYRFAFEAIYDCPGYWDEDIVWHAGASRPEEECLKLIINS